MAIFTELNFHVSEKLFIEVLKNPDQGSGYSIDLNKDELSALQILTMDYLHKCYGLNLLGCVNIIFTTEGIGEVKELRRNVEKIVINSSSSKYKYTISNSY
jgi:hypothetical protein